MIYIRATGNISPQKTYGSVAFLTEPVIHTGNRLTCLEPDYRKIIDPKLIRRMSRIIKMGLAAAMECLKEAAAGVPDVVTVNTPKVPTWNVVLVALVMAGGESTISVKLWVAFGETPLAAVMVIG